MDFILELDQKLFHLINSDLSNPALDNFMPWITNLHKTTSGLIFLGLVLGFMLLKFRKAMLKAILLGGVAVALSDSISHYVLKSYFTRIRPQELSGAIVRTFHHVGYSFPSNHAANNMAIAVILAFLIPRLRHAFFAWALLIGFSRIYVGVHYPIDVLAGYIVGALCAGLVLSISKRLKML